MSKFKLCFFGTLFSLTIVVCLGINSIFTMSSEEKENSTNNEPLTKSIIAPEPLSTIQSADTQDPTGYWTKEKMKNAIPMDKIINEEKESNILEKLESPSLGEPTDVSEPVQPQETIE
ncbi:hypothetical protein [Bacillus sp. TL12]|uniref:hypothetical protein n=1 Tax=Bacillus sp. TL12 TaxID=2894756 RepID=UPI001F51D34A|nr:hypothetical protein [Bacillus sp. TL12]MCI0768195.1 hypothetical protein [Bacillus sp. TL12]